MSDDRDHARMIEAMLFQSTEPVSERALARCLPDGADLHGLLEGLQAEYAHRGINLMKAGGSWAFNTATDVGERLQRELAAERKLSRAAIETLAIIAYHQPVTRGEIEEIRGVRVGRETLDILFSRGWIRLNGRRKTPGRPAIWATTDAFLRDFSLESLRDLPDRDALSAAGLLDAPCRAPVTGLADAPLGGSADDDGRFSTPE